jgi:alpha-L-rhamnosidase
MLKRILVVVFFCWCAVNSNGQLIAKTNWNAKWIGEAIESKPNTFYKFRHSFLLNKIPAKAITAIAVDSKYWLYINEKLVVFEGQLKRGPTPNDTYYDEIDVAKYLIKGNNTICILMWYWGKDGFCHKSSGKAGLLFEMHLANKKIISSAAWKIAQHLSYKNTSAPNPNFRLPEHNILYDAQLDNEDWLKKNYSDNGWAYASVLGNANDTPWNKLYKRPIPQWCNSGLVNYKNSIKIIDGKATMQLPKNVTVTPYLKIKAPAGLKIDIRTDNYNGGSAPNIRTEYITIDGVQHFESPAYFNGHQVVYTIPKGIEVLELKYRETKYNTKHIGYFKSDDAFLNTLWQKSTTTLNVNMRDGIYDSPDRERAQWWGDIVIVLEEIFYSCDNNGKAAIQKAISNLLEWQKPNGQLFSPIPAGNWDKELPAQMLASVGKYGIWKYIEMSGDTAMIHYAYPFIKKYMALWQLDKNGLVQHRAGDWDWHDWGDKIDVPVLDNAWYYMALDACNKMAIFLKLENDAVIYQQQMQSIKINFEKYFWKGNHFASDDYKFNADDRGNGLAVCAGLVTDAQWKLLKPILDTTFYAGPYLEKYILESYFIKIDALAAVQRMKKRYAAMVNNKNISTLWEGWEIGSSTYGGGTYNHGWTGGPLSLMSGYISGIRPTSFGYNNYEVKPQMAGLNNFNAAVQTAKGFIKVDCKKTLDAFVMKVQSIDAIGVIAMPKVENYKKIIFNGKNYNINNIKQDADYYFFNCYKKGAITIHGFY